MPRTAVFRNAESVCLLLEVSLKKKPRNYYTHYKETFRKPKPQSEITLVNLLILNFIIDIRAVMQEELFFLLMNLRLQYVELTGLYLTDIQGHSGDAGPIEEARPLTTQERAEIQTFPKGFVFDGSKTTVEQMIGNAVPVNLASYVATEIINSRFWMPD